jgi:hypothetical protein
LKGKYEPTDVRFWSRPLGKEADTTFQRGLKNRLLFVQQLVIPKTQYHKTGGCKK